jgi:hypothetical protein
LAFGASFCGSEVSEEGIGLLLAQMVFQRAEEERLPVLLYSTAEGKKLYLKAGFKGHWNLAMG